MSRQIFTGGTRADPPRSRPVRNPRPHRLFMYAHGTKAHERTNFPNLSKEGSLFLDAIRRSALVLVLSMLVAVAAQAQQPVKRGLLREAAAVDLSSRATDVSRAEAVRFVNVNLDMFGADGPPDAASPIELDLDLLRDADGHPFVAVPDSANVLASGRVAWTGHLAGVELSAVTFVIDRQAGTLTGSISYPGGTYRIESADGGVHVVL